MKSEQLDASPEIIEVAPSILRLQLQIEFTGLGHVNTYALEDENGFAIVDPGLPGEVSWKLLQERLAAAEIPLEPRAHRGRHPLASGPLRRGRAARRGKRRAGDGVHVLPHVVGPERDRRGARRSGRRVDDDVDDGVQRINGLPTPFGRPTPWGGRDRTAATGTPGRDRTQRQRRAALVPGTEGVDTGRRLRSCSSRGPRLDRPVHTGPHQRPSLPVRPGATACCCRATMCCPRSHPTSPE